jgi:hypothetical protein
MDRVGSLLDEIAKIPEMGQLEPRAGKFLNELAEIYERHGAGTTRAFLFNKRGRETALFVKILDKLEACPEVRTNRAIGRQIIKCLGELTRQRGAGR